MNEILNIKVQRIFRFENENSLKALCDLVFGDIFLVRGFGVFQGEKGTFVSMPRKQNKNGRWFNVFIPSTNEIREYINDVVLDAYRKKED